MSKTEITLGGNKYTPSKEWGNDIVSFNVEDGQSFGTGVAFFEAFDDKFYVRGEGKSIQEAENIALEKYKTIKNCDHDFSRLNDYGLATCTKCKVRGTFLENITTCSVCSSVPIGFINSELFCFSHYPLKLKSLLDVFGDWTDLNKEESEEKFSLTYKLLFFTVVTEKGHIHADSTHDDVREYFYEKNTETFKLLMTVAEKLAEEIQVDRSFASVQKWSVDFDRFYDILRCKKDIVEMAFNVDSIKDIMDKSRQYVF